MDVQKVKQFMYGEAATSTSATELAEETAIEFGCVQWLDDSDHQVWQLALDVWEDINGEIR